MDTTSTAQAPVRSGDVICLVGNALAERMQHHGWLEARLQARFAGEGVVVRNLGFGADELTVHQRTMNFGKFTADGMAMNLENERFVPWDRYLDHAGADVVFAFFGFNESFAGVTGVAGFRQDLEAFVEHVRTQRYGDEPARLVLFGPLPFENTGNPDLPDGNEHNAQLTFYNKTIERVARASRLPFVDLMGPMAERYAASDTPLTIDGIHLTEAGNAVLAEVIEEALFGRVEAVVDEDVRQAVLEKNHLWFNRYRATDGYNTYGGRSRQIYAGDGTDATYANFDVMQREMDHIDVLVANRDAQIHALARGESLDVDDSNAPPLIAVVTNKPGDGADASHMFLGGEQALEEMEAGEGLNVQLFADERQFPELANPVQMSWDPAGRLWVAVWPTYPHWRPGDPMDDKLLVLEDTDGDGRADECTTFAGDLHNPTGFEHWNGGVLLASAPDLLFLEDTDGDGVADHRERLLHGLSSADTHHSANSFVLGPDGALYFQEGTFHQTQIETVYGPVRNRDGCVWRFEPRTFRVERYVAYNFANPHGHVVDGWGQHFVTDGTGNVNYYALPFSGFLPEPLKHRSYFPFFQQRSRPAGGTEILSSAHFPDDFQGDYLIANVIGFRGIFRYDVSDDGAGFSAQEAEPIVASGDRNFRPVDLEIGPDGALYFLDWHNPLIGHLQHHIRDPSRDGAHGRIYRVTYEDRLLSRPQEIDGQPIGKLLDLLKSREDRVRYRARIELSERDSDEVTEEVHRWALSLSPNDPEHERHLLEALWVSQQHNRLNQDVLDRLLIARDARVRAAAVRVCRYMRHALPDALQLIQARTVDTDPRVRLEAVVAASAFDSLEAVAVALASLNFPSDKFLDYALGETVRALEPHWMAALESGRPIALGNPAAMQYLLDQLDVEALADLPRQRAVAKALLERGGVSGDMRLEAADALAEKRGTTRMDELMAAVVRLDVAESAQASRTIEDLSAAVLADGAAGIDRLALMLLAQTGERAATRGFALAALMVQDGGAESAWEIASTSRRGVRAFLAAVALLPDPGQREAVYPRVRSLALDPLAEPLDGDAGQTTEAGGRGLQARFFEPSPPDATRETFDALTPSVTWDAATVSAEPPAGNETDSYGLTFQGSLLVPVAGEYTFYLTSDDGSRLYLGDECVIDNDGAHSMNERSGTTRLDAGAHPLLVTFFEQGGDQGLHLAWEGPGLDRERIPAERFELPTEGSLQAAAVRALAVIPGRDDERLDIARVSLGRTELFDASLDVMRSIDVDASEASRLAEATAALASYGEGVPVLERTSPRVVAALDVARRLAEPLTGDSAQTLVARLDALTAELVVLRTLPHQMLFDVPEFWVEAGRPVTLVFENNDVMPHNVVITATGAMVVVGEAAEALTEGDFVPDVEGVLWNTRLLLPGESQTLTFVAPSTAGDYPYVCTYPGHWRVMNGIMRVVERAEDRQEAVSLAEGEAEAQRQFVRDWTLDDLTPLFDGDWKRGRSTERGRAAFQAAGCLQCHRVDASEGSDAGPLLADIRSKYRDADLLRHILQPSYEILPDYKLEVFQYENGRLVTGRVFEEDDDVARVMPTLLRPDYVVDVEKAELADRYETPLSPMPTGLLVTLNEDEILDLVHFLQAGPEEADDPWVSFDGAAGLPGNGKHVVFLAGDEEYRSEEALPMLARLLATRHGFRTTVLFATDPETGEIDADEQTNVPGMHLVDDADLVVCFWRFRELPDEDMKHFVDYVESGRPLIGIRTATHAFAYGRNPNSPYAHYAYNSREWPGGFGQQVLGETWVAHHGAHGSEATRGVVDPAAADHPVLRGVDDVWGPTDVYSVVHLDESSQVLLRGQILGGMEATSLPVEDERNDPMMPLVWVRELPVAGTSRTQRILCSTIGASVDFQSEGLRRVLVNGCYWAVGLEEAIDPESSVDIVGTYVPTFFGFGQAQRGVRAVDFLRD